MSHVKTTIAELQQIVPLVLASGNKQPIGLIGPVGVGKTQYFKGWFRDMYAEHVGLASDQIGFIQERVANRDSAEIAGVALPSKDADGNLRTTFTVAPLITKIRDTGKEYGIVLIDELMQATADVQKVLADLLDPAERTVGGWAIPDGWIVCFTGNRTSDKSGASRMLSHLLNRCVVFEMAFDVNGWAGWAEQNDVNPLAIDCAMAYADEGFFADCVPTEDGPFCTPRSLARAAQHLTAFTESDAFDGVTVPSFVESLIASNIGAKSAGTLVRHIAMADQVPTADEILADPDGANVPDATGYQLLAANRAINAAHDADTGEAALAYVVRLRPDLQVSLGSKLLRASARNGWTLTSDVAVAFIQKFHDLLPLAHDAGMEV
tara:strand:- start:810 stop:1946 length:1137 start_codon:yes stop_codon:yes gene_type:complete